MEARKFQWTVDTPVIGWGVFVLYMSVLPSEELPEIFIETSDLILHMGVYFIWIVLALLAVVVKEKKLSRSRVVRAVIIALSYSLVIELIQEFGTMYRTFSWMDLLANTTGCILGVWVFRLVFQFYSRSREME